MELKEMCSVWFDTVDAAHNANDRHKEEHLITNRDAKMGKNIYFSRSKHL